MRALRRGNEILNTKRVAAGIAAVLGLSGMAAFPTPALAQPASATPVYDIPAGPLGPALNRLGRASGVAISYDPAVVSGKTTRGLRGSHSPAQALQRLLRGTDLRALPDGAGGFVLSVQAASVRSRPQSSGVRQRADDVPAEGSVSEIVVLGKSYGIEVGAKTLAPLREVPNTVTLVDQRRIAEQNLFTLNELAVQTTGLSSVGGGDGDVGNIRSRGFNIDNYLVDGVPNALFFGKDFSLFSYDRLEVLRGPAGLFSGAGNPAGSINLVRKRPFEQLTVNMLAAAGSWNNYRGELDASTPIIDGIAARAGLAYEDRDYYYDVVEKKRLSAFGVVAANLGERTTLTIGVNYDKTDGGRTSGVPAMPDGSLPNFLPRSVYGGLDWTYSKYRTSTGYAEIRHELGDDWVVRANAWYGKIKTDLVYAYVAATSPSGITPTSTIVPIRANGSIRNQEYLSADFNAVGKVHLFGRSHDVIIGGDYQHAIDNRRNPTRLLLGTVDLLNPDYDKYPEPNLPITSASNTKTDQFGIYGQVRLQVADPLKLILGGRLSWVDRRTHVTLPARAPTEYEKHGRLTPYAGIVFDVASNWSLYGSYADTFTQQDGLLSSGDTVPPSTSEQFEAGTKMSLFGDRLLLSLAAYQIKQTGRIIVDPVDTRFVVLAGRVRNRGIEFEANGEILPGWRVNGGYAYNKTRYFNDPANLQNAYSMQAPDHSIKVWTSYRPPEGPLSRLTLGGGVNWQSKTSASLSEIFGPTTVPVRQGAYALVDVRAAYDLSDNITLAVNVNNLFDKRYWERMNGVQYGNTYGAPRNVLATVRARF